MQMQIWEYDNYLINCFYFQVLNKFLREANQRKFCYDNFLSFHTLNHLENLRSEFMRHLFELDFITDLNPKNLENNQNSLNLSLVRAVICAGLYPNVALIK